MHGLLGLPPLDNGSRRLRADSHVRAKRLSKPCLRGASKLFT